MRTGQRRRVLTELAALTHQLTLEHARALERLNEWSAGFPTGGEGGSNPPPSDEEPGDPIDYSDRTGNLATIRCQHREDITAFDRLIEDAVRSLRRAQRITQAALVAGTAVSQAPGCVSCARDTDHRGSSYRVPAWRSGLCQWCSDWLSSHGCWPPVPVLEAHHAGTVVTPRLASRLMAADQ